MDYIVDFDDFYPENTSIGYLVRLRRNIPGFKVTLFTIPGRCTERFIDAMRGPEYRDWIDLVPHGLYHNSCYECANWSEVESLTYLKQMEEYGFTRGFKAPGWQISDGLYNALLHRRWWVADQLYNTYRRPKGLRAYVLDQPNKIHGHIGHHLGINANAIENIWQDIIDLRGNFHFIKDVV